MAANDKGGFSMAQKSILNDTPIRLIQKYHKVLIQNGIPVTALILFGSYAKGNPKPWSDVDVCVVSPIFGKDRHDEGVRLALLTRDIEDMIEPHPYNEKDLADPWDPLAAEIRKYGKVIV